MNTFGNKMRKKDLKTFECEVCHKEFKQKFELSQHQLTHQKQKCRVCNREIRPDTMENHLKTHENEKERKFQCEICSLKFLTAISLRNHGYYHNQKEKADLQCQFCFKKFNVKKHFERHMKSHARFLKCDHCGFLFTRKDQLMAHMKKHMAAEIFKCGTCDKTFKSKTLLKIHQTTHLKAYECDVCGHKFATNYYVRQHKIANHQEQSQKFECQICKMRFKVRSKLKRHQMVHQARKTCGICQKSIAANSYRYHMKLHQLKKQEKKFECQVCQKKFLTKWLLISHIKTHEKSFECDLCGHRVASKVQMKNHLISHLRETLLQTKSKSNR
jgi:KRAB domain-containing zinc finger protein